MINLLVTHQNGDVQRHRFDKPTISVGRGTDNDVVLPFDTVSRNHARIALKDGKFILVDRNSTNGVYVNGRRIRGAVLVRPRDVIELGGFTLRLVQPAVAVELPEPPPSA
jgi:pSer/pThr/pTyr-binding forkhead associated (FHA) protein